RRLRQQMMGEAGQVSNIQRSEAVDVDAFVGNLASRREVEPRLAGDHDDLVLRRERLGESADIDFGAALDKRRVEIAHEADLHAAFRPSPARGEGISPTSDLRAASILLT